MVDSALNAVGIVHSGGAAPQLRMTVTPPISQGEQPRIFRLLLMQAVLPTATRKALQVYGYALSGSLSR